MKQKPWRNALSDCSSWFAQFVFLNTSEPLTHGWHRPSYINLEIACLEVTILETFSQLKFPPVKLTKSTETNHID